VCKNGRGCLPARASRSTHIWTVSTLCQSLQAFCTSTRKCYLRSTLQEEKPTWVGVGLRVSDWTSLLSIKSTVEADFPHLSTAEACHNQESHRNLMFALECRECNQWAQWHLSDVANYSHRAIVVIVVTIRSLLRCSRACDWVVS